ncbi:MAG: protein-glutamate O-methyltransferase [Mariprofundaceae bacterium]|nr:protein-glutamate O-methyltransferase [Mariprofundaceae bacterium]
MSAQHEYHFSDRHFKHIAKLVYQHTGIHLKEGKEELVYSRMVRRIRALGLATFDEYIELIQSGHDAELEEFTNAITTNLTAFFREKHHFEYIKDVLMPALLAEKKKKGEQKIRIWSAGCSSGEEPYSIAMTIVDLLPAYWDVKILATDLDSQMVEHSAKGIYDLNRLEKVDKSLIKRWFKQGSGANSGKVRVAQQLKDMITFKQLNLLHDWPMQGEFDFIFCRNVIIYFDHATKAKLCQRYAGALIPQGHLFIGHSESLFRVNDDFKLIGNTIYQNQGVKA